jgi:uncharacterized protein YjbI with pentapeptide repeats
MPRRVIAQPLPMDIRNWSFRGRDCEGWDFEGRDIRGCNFSDAKLASANFSQVIAGRSRIQVVLKTLITVTAEVLLFFVCAFRVSTTIKFVDVVEFVGSDVVVNERQFLKILEFALTVATAVKFKLVGILAGVSVGAVLRTIQAFSKGQTAEITIFSAMAIVCFLLALYCSREAVREFKNAIGTKFEGADLKGATFSSATLNSCSFDKAETAYVNWSHVEGARSTINFTTTKMQLLTSRKGNSSMYSSLDLSEQDLAGVALVKANLTDVDLSRSNLQNADLTLANLTNANVSDTDLRHATLTGACIQNWTINSGTQFDGLICEHIFLTPDRHPQNRRPLSGSFAPGDFAKFVDRAKIS